ncbi:endonuclease/exonuclease/phosphatase family protein [Aureibacter tunicatorum]|uniref:Endonuclease/exonuclease/phosphatase family metal-dependent hydrolase n=1 Tax=Aureibacter tunicatorum TaxID=866807 RepID=A0AAE4BST7_9BACT|nr:endonuclease/exonuclease/phosphatase family protein [Aureibacter tunicatorum]MDR6241539.1 endonuclease/exonuclease/phosphatase family metal-dependent hydrolase [Aureibacter tunicatorum]BDD07237.1 hypothetical protein AUTU_47200 [Aureibacter tunicatorum]
MQDIFQKRVSFLFNFTIILFGIVIFSSCDEQPAIPDKPVEKECEIDYDNTLNTESCFSSASSDNLDIVTWNLEHFPNTGMQPGWETNDPDETRLDAVAGIIESSQFDVIAMQEIVSTRLLDELSCRLGDEWEHVSYTFSEGANMAFFFNASVVKSLGHKKILANKNYDFASRPPLQFSFEYKNEVVNLINIHMKCCNDGQARRKNASKHLKEYIDENLDKDNVIVLGDYNEEIYDYNGAFSNFLDDSQNFKFADGYIESDKLFDEYSYPSWPSHIDHILISNELFDNLDTAYTIKFDNCDSKYFSRISDHRAVYIRLKI